MIFQLSPSSAHYFFLQMMWSAPKISLLWKTVPYSKAILLNYHKCSVVHYYLREAPFLYNYHLNEFKIVVNDQCKDLGVTTSSDLNFDFSFFQHSRAWLVRGRYTGMWFVSNRVPAGHTPKLMCLYFLTCQSNCKKSMVILTHKYAVTCWITAAGTEQISGTSSKELCKRSGRADGSPPWTQKGMNLSIESL